ncbi:hypothetical protein [Nostoc sp. UIC 10630]|nr:hypothetical protein [Nostoc sp. UIC 10630]
MTIKFSTLQQCPQSPKRSFVSALERDLQIALRSRSRAEIS